MKIVDAKVPYLLISVEEQKRLAGQGTSFTAESATYVSGRGYSRADLSAKPPINFKSGSWKLIQLDLEGTMFEEVATMFILFPLLHKELGIEWNNSHRIDR